MIPKILHYHIVYMKVIEKLFAPINTIKGLSKKYWPETTHLATNGEVQLNHEKIFSLA